MESDKREYSRVSVSRLPSFVKNSEGIFEVVEKSIKPLDIYINIKDVSVGGLRMSSGMSESAQEEFKKGTSCEIVLPKVKDLDSKKLKCEVTRAKFIKSIWVHDIGFKFMPANTDYLKQFVEIIKNHYIK